MTIIELAVLFLIVSGCAVLTAAAIFAGFVAVSFTVRSRPTDEHDGKMVKGATQK